MNVRLTESIVNLWLQQGLSLQARRSEAIRAAHRSLLIRIPLASKEEVSCLWPDIYCRLQCLRPAYIALLQDSDPCNSLRNMPASSQCVALGSYVANSCPVSFAVEAQHIVKRFGAFTAVDRLSMTIPRGAFYAFLGPNGAGKSTTISMLTALALPDAGRLTVLGLDAVAQPLELKRRIGVVPEELALFERLTGLQHLTFCGRMHGLSADEAVGRAHELLTVTELAHKADGLIAEYSKGMRRRLAIAASLIHRPELVFLDEPFEGIDVMAAGIIRELLADLSHRGVTLLLTTHVLEIAERLATHAGVIRAGALVAEGSISALKEKHAADTLEQVFEKLVGAPAARGVTLSFYGAPR
jgi:ABC-2 type transport system ATP-binding protein